jgi:flagellar basal body-associated protein FliL
MNSKKIILIGGVGLISAIAGILLPTMMSGGHGPETSHATAAPAKDAHAAKDAHGKDSHGAKDAHAAKDDHGAKSDGHGGGHGGKDEAKKEPKVGPVYLPFERVMVNLNEPNLVKYLSIDITVQTDGKYEDEVKAVMKEKRAVLMTFLTSHIADKTTDEVRGKVGVNRLRREIQDNFNLLLFKDGHERIQDIFFEEYHLQQ